MVGGMVGDGRDPLEKLNDLRSWLANNKVEAAPRPAKNNASMRITVETDRAQAPEVRREIADFEQWVNEIQSPAKPQNGNQERQFWG